MSSNKTLRSAAKNKNDEFYTQLEDIEKEILGGGYDLKQFENKTVFCNCDDPYESNFTKFFIYNFNYLKLKRLICTCFKGSMIAVKGNLFKTILPQQQGYVLDISEVPIKEGLTYEEVAKYINKNKLIKNLQGNGDFRSPEVIEYLKQADIVITNPPFSLFREYIAQLIEYKKQFLVMGNGNSLICKEIFPLFMNNIIWFGKTGGTMTFRIRDDFDQIIDTATKRKNDGHKWQDVQSIAWFTNLDLQRKHERLVLYKTYKGNEKDYPKYDNYNAINVDKVQDIPIDYQGYMGVPISFIGKHNPEQFKILGFTNTGEENKGIRLENTQHGRAIVKGKEIYTRLLIQRINKEDN